MKDQNIDKNPKSGFVPEAVRSSKHGSYKKKSGNNNSLNSEATNFKGLGFRIGRDGAKIYEKTVDKLALYTSTQFKNGSDVVVCLQAEEYVRTEVPVLPDNPTENDKHVWQYEMNDYPKTEKTLKGNLRNLYTVIMSLCNAEVKNQVRALEGFREFDKKLDSMMLLKEIKKIVYTGGSNNLHAKHNKAMDHINFMDLRQEKYQDIQDFRDQYLKVKKVCDELDLTFGRCESDAKALLKAEGVSEPTEEQLEDALNRVEEEHHAIIFLYKSDRQRFGKYITEKENEILQKKDPFPKTVEDMCRVLEGWKNDNKRNRISEANDRVAFATTDTAGSKGKSKNKKVTCFKCKKKGHYANECEEVSDDDDESVKEKKSSNKKGSNFMNHGRRNKKKADEEEEKPAILVMGRRKF